MTDHERNPDVIYCHDTSSLDQSLTDLKGPGCSGRKLTVGSLFAGIGGMDLGLERTGGFEVRWQCEIDPYCQRVLAKHWPNVKRYGDIRELRDVERVDLLCGGFPCQDVSHAGPRVGIGGERSGLWAEFARLIRDLRPRYGLVENVSGLLDRGVERVLGDLAEIGYDAEWECISACAFGAPHTRQRVFVLAYPEGERPGQLRRIKRTIGSEEKRNIHWPKSEPECERVAYGVPARLDRIAALGNAVVPQIVEWIGNQILAYERSLTEVSS